jgi:RimJ/RimL family protein N-acetyltransferase
MPPAVVSGKELPRLVGGRVELRPIAEADATALLAIFGDPEVTKFWSAPPLPDLAAAERLARDIRDGFRDRRLFQWGVSLRETGELLGTCTLFHLVPEHRRAELGFALRRTAWGQGLAREALGVLVAFCFETLGLHRLEADVDPDNARCLRTLERLGFRREGYLRGRWHEAGGARDAVFLGLLRSDWKAA